MGTTPTVLYLNAALICKSRTFSAITDVDAVRCALDVVYASAVAYVLEQADWFFAKRAATINGSAAAAYGYAYTYTKPTDMVRTISISANSGFYPPLARFEEDNTNWYAAGSTIYVTYVSSHASYGLDLTKWPERFAKAVEAYLALLIYPQIASAPKEEIDRVRALFEQRLAVAKSVDAPNQNLRLSAVAFVLKQADWVFAKRQATITGSGGGTYGYSYTHAKPADFVRLIAISANVGFYPPLARYDEDGTNWYAADATTYVTYVSNGATYGGNQALWPDSFVKCVDAYLALLVHRNAKLGSSKEEQEEEARLEGVYNGALARARLVDAPNQNLRLSAVAFVLEQASWNFATRGNSIAGSTAAYLGYAKTFAKPSDFVRLISISTSSTYYPPLEHYAEDGTNFYGADTPIYISYVSDGAAYGGNQALWPDSFTKAVEAYLALLNYRDLAKWLGKEDKAEETRLQGVFDTVLAAAVAKDAINQVSRVIASSRESLYQGALRLVGFRPLLRSSDEAVQRRRREIAGPAPAQDGSPRPGGFATEALDELTARRILDESYDGSVAYMVQQGLWNFAQRSVAIEASTDVEPEFGFTSAFEKPDDFVRLVAIANNDQFYPMLGAGEFIEEGGYWNANVSVLYVIYISDDSDRGTDMNVWPRTVKRALEHYLALELAPSMRLPAVRINQLKLDFRASLRDSRSKDAMDQAPGRMAPGRLAASRSRSAMGRRGGGPDRLW